MWDTASRWIPASALISPARPPRRISPSRAPPRLSRDAWTIPRTLRRVRRESPPATLSSASSERPVRGPPAPPRPCHLPTSRIWAVPAPTSAWASRWIPCRVRASPAGPIPRNFPDSQQSHPGGLERSGGRICVAHRYHGDFHDRAGPLRHLPGRRRLAISGPASRPTAQGSSYIVGETASGNFPTTANAIQGRLKRRLTTRS